MGKSIRIYLPDGDVGGIRHAEIVNWTGQALAFPRNRLSDLKAWPEVKRQGVYFLLGQDEETGQDAVYIGEAEIVANRVAQHVSTKEFWSECIAFTSKDENLTKSHVKYLESKLVSSAVLAERYLVKNSSNPQESGLPRADRDTMDEFASHIKTLLGVLGHRVLDPLSPITKAAFSEEALTLASVSTSTPSVDEFFLKVKNISANAVRNSNALVVLKGSKATKNPATSLSAGYRALWDKLISIGVLVSDGEVLMFSRDYAFTSPSQAAAVIIGYPMNGRTNWKSASGISFGDIEDAEAKALGRELLADLTQNKSI